MPSVAKLVAPFRVQSTGHQTITPAEIAQFIKRYGSRSKAVFALVMLMFTGFRVSDLAQIGPSIAGATRCIFASPSNEFHGSESEIVC